jgi:hypothetical protein
MAGNSSTAKRIGLRCCGKATIAGLLLDGDQEGLPEGSGADARIYYHCSACHHEMRLTVWATGNLGASHDQ